MTPERLDALANELREFYTRAADIFEQLNARVTSLEIRMGHAQDAMQALHDALQLLNERIEP